LSLSLILEIRLDFPGELDRQWIAKPVLGIAGGDPDPSLALAIFLDIGLLDAFEADADVARQRFLVKIGAARVAAEPVGRRVGRHGEPFERDRRLFSTIAPTCLLTLLHLGI
jgi:hypothetical protein